MTGPYTVADLLAAMTDGPVRAGSALARQTAPEATQEMLDSAFSEMQRAHVAGERRDWQAAERAIDRAYGLLRAAKPVPIPGGRRSMQHPLRHSRRDTL